MNDFRIRHFPGLWPCPVCECREYLRRGCSSSGDFQYRTCKRCAEPFKVAPIAIELSDGKGRSFMVDPKNVR
jgi:hypothetical protein